MSEYTKGPWSVQFSEECTGRKLDELVRWVITANDHDLWISTGPTWDSEWDQESIANAHLIAASPDLLEALSALLERAEDELADPQDLWEITAAKEAIAKATGRRKISRS